MFLIKDLHKRLVLFLGSFIFYNKIAPHGKNSLFPGFSGSTVQQAGAGAAAQTRIWRPNTSSKPPPGEGKGGGPAYPPDAPIHCSSSVKETAGNKPLLGSRLMA